MKVLAGARIPEGRLEADCPKSTRWIDPATSEWASDEDREADRHADRESRVRELRVWADGNEEDGKNNCEGTQAASQVIGHMSFTQSKLTALGPTREQALHVPFPQESLCGGDLICDCYS